MRGTPQPRFCPPFFLGISGLLLHLVAGASALSATGISTSSVTARAPLEHVSSHISTKGTPVPSRRMLPHDDGYVQPPAPSTDPWIQMGTDIADPAGCSGFSYGGSNFGSVLSSSRDGSRLAVSRALHYVKVYEWSDATNWTESGQVALDGDGFGSSMQMSGDGTHIAIGGGGNVAVYEYKANAWYLKGSFLQSDHSPHNGFGDSVSISDDGTRLAVGEPQHENNPFNCTDEASQGAARVYEWNNGQSRWDKMGSSFFCHNKTDDQVGYSISISGDGNRVAVGAPKADAPEYCEENGMHGPGAYCYSPSQNRGQVRVYEWSANSWQLMGGVPGGYIDGTEQQSELGTSVALSRDGSRIIAGAPLRDSCATDSGAAVVYEWIQARGCK